MYYSNFKNFKNLSNRYLHVLLRIYVHHLTTVTSIYACFGVKTHISHYHERTKEGAARQPG